jgi:2-methylcitrate dehydratase PrpD
MTGQVQDFIHGLRAKDIPDTAFHATRRCLLDTVAVMLAGTHTETGRLLRDHVATVYPAGAAGARLPLDGRRAAAPAAAMAGAGATDSLDGHDGHRLCKGHVGAAMVPGLLAFADTDGGCDLGEFILRLLVGYEIATRAGIALHRISPQYHTSGAWNALGVAAIGTRMLGFESQRTASALGAAEFYAPRGLMMRVIDQPSMLKDGSQMGAFAGVAATLLARDGFRAGCSELIESEDVSDLWADLGTCWRVEEQYFKPYPVCRWAQPALEAAAQLQGKVPADAIDRIRVRTFTEGVRLAGHAPANGDEAQYAIAFPVAALLRHGRLAADEITGSALTDRRTLDLAARVELIPDDRFDARFPAERWCEMEIATTDGQILQSGETATRGDPETALSDTEIVKKAQTLTEPILDSERIERLVTATLHGKPDTETGRLLDDVLNPPDTLVRVRPAATV